MNTLVLTENGKLDIERRERPAPQKGEVLLRVRACGLCSSDRARAFERGAYRYPLVLGHEISGEIAGLGEEVPDGYLGRQAAVFPLLPCKRCEACARGQYAMCNSYDYFGSRRDGGFQEYLTVPVFNLVLLPEKLSFAAAALCEPAAVAVHAVSRAEPSGEERIAVVGTGTIAILTALYCQSLGLWDVRLYGRNERKLDWIRQVFRIRAQRLNLEAEELADVVLECVGSKETVAAALRAVRRRGRLILVGNPEGDMNLEKDVYWRILRKELLLCGSWNSDFGGGKDDWAGAAKFLEKCGAGIEALITERYPLESGAKAFERLRGGEGIYGKLMIVMGRTGEKDYGN